METSDPQMARFLQQLQSETQRQKFTEQVHTLTGRCWDVCFADYRPPSKLDGKTSTCLQVGLHREDTAQSSFDKHCRVESLQYFTPSSMASRRCHNFLKNRKTV
ncbi:Mitochondrial import inner membrane translocase subunit tim-8 [Trichostrongylus colubriformis]|uniref:Mitochondrial import inner membrane translocase subunit n=1 Tax=Trichostrongylus colubriformis TaxID=6319 RepID=A0AAN8FL55_TRICO